MKKFLIYVVLALVVGFFGARFYVQHRTERALDEAIALLPPGVRVSYGSVASTLDGELSIRNLSIKTPEYQDEFLLGSVGLRLDSFFDILELDKLPQRIAMGSDDVPDRMAVFVDDFLVDTNADYLKEMLLDFDAARIETGQPLPDPESDPIGYCLGGVLGPGGFTSIGLSEIPVSFSYGYQSKPDQFILSAMFKADGVFSLDANITFDGNIRSLASMNPGRLTMAGFEITTFDERITDMMYRRCERLGVDRETAKAANYAKTVETLAGMGFIADARFLEPLRLGIDAEHRTMVITGDPPSPVELSRIGLYKPEDIPALLGVDIRTE